MFFRILRKDLQRNKIITLILFLFIMLAALLVSGGTILVLRLTGSIDYLLDKADVPHYVQMNSGVINEADINQFIKANRIISKQQNIAMINIDGAKIHLKYDQNSEADSVIDNGFVTQNKSFDYLLNRKNDKIKVHKGEIAVPIYYMQKNDLKIGDRIRIGDGKFSMVFTISDFVRDALMNPSVISSKRFVVNESDYNTLKHIGVIEYLIEFQLNDLSKLKEFSNTYQSSDLPKKGPSIDYNLFVLLNAITDGIMIAVMILVSLLLIIIAVLCLRFTMIAAIEEDYREIGVMKAIGISQKDIRSIYLIKYAVLSITATLTGYLLSIPAGRLLTSNIALYIGLAPLNLKQVVIPFLGAAFVGLLIIICCILVLRRFKKISAVEALRSGNTAGLKKSGDMFLLSNRKHMGVNLFLGVKDVFCSMRMYGLLFFIFILCSFIIIVPVNMLNTMKSPVFMSYMGVGFCEVRFDLQQTDHTIQRFYDIQKYLKNDKDVTKMSALITCRLRMKSTAGTWEGIDVETGDQTIFPLKYMEGASPTKDNEIALSYLCAKNAEKKVGDKLYILSGGKQKAMTISGIYQDITNGGITAKANMKYDPDTALRYVINVDLKQGTVIKEKIAEYSSVYHLAKVTDTKVYASQTMGETIGQLKLITIAAILIAIAVSVLITSFFLKMLMAKDATQNAIMKSLGFMQNDIRKQYLTRMLLLLSGGIILGTIASNSLGEMLVSLVISNLGASRIEFIINPLQSYLLYPLCFIAVVTITTLAGIRLTGKTNIRQMVSE